MGGVWCKVEKVWGTVIIPADVLQHMLQELQGVVGAPSLDVYAELFIVATNHLVILINRDVRT